jgi:Cu/Ag efflux pump CusA
MAEMKQRFPDDMDYAISLDQTLAVTEGMKEIIKTLLIAIALVILVVYLFLQDWRATLIPLLAVPVSLVGTFILFPLFGFSINTLSMFGLVLAVGLVVDDAIVKAYSDTSRRVLLPRTQLEKQWKNSRAQSLALPWFYLPFSYPQPLFPASPGGSTSNSP